jgi:GTP cyclohydrolase II
MPKNERPHLVLSEEALLPTDVGVWHAVAFRNDAGALCETHLALTYGKISGAALPVRIHSECLTGEVFGSKRCDCREQLRLAMRRIHALGRGMIIYLRQEGRGIGIFNKIRAYHLQDHGCDTIEANERLGLPVDSRNYAPAVALLKALKIKSVRLFTNNPAKISALKSAGIRVAGRLPLRTRPNRWDRRYLNTKKELMGHDL